jgi:hypothetical protein
MAFKVGDLVRYINPPTNDHKRYEGEITSIAGGSITIIWRDVTNKDVETTYYTPTEAATQLRKSVPANKLENTELQSLLLPKRVYPKPLRAIVKENTRGVELQPLRPLTPPPPPSGSHGGGTKKRSRRRKQRKSRRSKRSVRI